MWKWPDELLIGQCKHNITQGFLLVSLLSYQKAAFFKLPIIIKFVFRAFLYLNSSSFHVVLNRYWAHTYFDKSYRENQTIFETLWGKLQNLLGMKLTTSVTLLLLSAVDNDIYTYFFHVTGVHFEINWISEHLLY